MNGTVRCPNCFTLLFEPRPRPQVQPVQEPRRRPWLAGAQAQRPAEPPPPERPPAKPHGPSSCPTCSYTMPPDWYSAPTTCVVAAGARATGKSIYLAVMIKQLEHLATGIGLQVRPASHKVAEAFDEHYVRWLYRQRGIMPATRTSALDEAYQRDSMVFVLTTRWDQRHHLVIRDVAGEDLENPEESRERLGFLGHADVIFFLYDPLRIPEIRNKLRIAVAEQTVGAPPLDVLDNTLSLVHGPPPRLGVIMSKFDVMQALQVSELADEWTAIMSNAGAGINSDPGPLGRPDEVRGDLVHEEVRSLLMMLDASPLVYRVQNKGGGGVPGGHRFFAVSALGHAPNGEALNSRGIAPFRALDPLRWALEGTGVLS